MKKFATLLGSLCTLVVTNLPLPALAIPSDFDYKSSPEEYHPLPDLSIPYRTLPRKFDFPIITEIDIDNNVSTDNPITDAFVDNLPSIPTGITLDELLRYRAEYTASHLARVELSSAQEQETHRLCTGEDQLNYTPNDEVYTLCI